MTEATRTETILRLHEERYRLVDIADKLNLPDNLVRAVITKARKPKLTKNQRRRQAGQKAKKTRTAWLSRLPDDPRGE